MPQPPAKNESKEGFISRCMKYLAEHENKTGEKASGQCYGMWRNKKGRKVRVKRSKHG